MTNRWLGLPIFALVMFLVYYISMVTVGAAATDWANDGLFGDGFHLFGIGSAQYEEVSEEYGNAMNAINAFVEIDTEAEDFDEAVALEEIKNFVPESTTGTVEVEDEETLAVNELTTYYDAIPAGEEENDNVVPVTYVDAAAYIEKTALKSPIPPTTACGCPAYPCW